MLENYNNFCKYLEKKPHPVKELQNPSPKAINVCPTLSHFVKEWNDNNKGQTIPFTENMKQVLKRW